DHKASRGFTLVELLIVIGVIVVLIALLLPSVASVRARARTAECQSNLAQLGLALKAANRNRSTPVRSSSWAADIAPFLEGENEELFVCPADFQAENRNAEEQDPTNPQFQGSFGANNQMHRMQGSDANKFTLVDLGDGDADGANESQFFVSPEQDADNQWSTNPNGQAIWNAGINDASDRHAGNINVLRSDGSVSAESSDDLLENHPGSGSGDWVPWRFSDERWEGSNAEANPDRDGDGILNSDDNCPDTFNPGQADADGNNMGDACEPVEEEEAETGGEDTGSEDTGGEDTGGGGEDSTPLEDEGCYDTELGFPEVTNLHVRSIHGSGDVGPIRLDPNHFRFLFISMDDCNNYELWYEDWSDWDYDMHFRFQRILSGSNAGKIRLSVKFVTPAYAHYYLFLDENGTPLPGNLTHYCNSSGYQTCGDNETFIETNVWLESSELIDGHLDRPCACPPAVDAGADVSFAYPKVDFQLLGDASVDSSTGLPSEVLWTQVSGPPGVAFSDATALQPTATFPGEGVYVLKLTGMAGGGNASDEVQITVLPEGSTLYRYVRVKHTGAFGPLCLANVKIINNDGVNVAPMGMASCASGWNQENPLVSSGCSSFFQSQANGERWWMVEFGEASTIASIEIENACGGLGSWLDGAQVEALDENQTKIWNSEGISGASDGSIHTFSP
ncbi:MAG: prepilin-type N-terminal cleavage/methylation domain-containing protein, partial [Pirellulales bacterium]|nr:prepilin-type N-terminal cleavage/methylation domain-containing protein [Pirellulales bacterium]